MNDMDNSSPPASSSRIEVIDPDEAAAFLRSFQDEGSEGAVYLADHFKRFLETLRAVPPARSEDSILELGAAFHHLTPGLARFGGYTRITCNDLWTGDARTTRTIRSHDGSFALDVVVDNFDVEKDRYPYEDGAFDGVVCCEILEHLGCDPMAMLWEINRVLKTGGWLVLTTPNVASLKGAASLLRGGTPYVWGPYPVGGRPSDRHNREYSALEVRKVLELAGFSIGSLITAFSWSDDDPELAARLGALGFPTELRGDNTIVVARRAGPPQSRYPSEIYQAGGFGHASQNAGEEAGEATGSSALRPAPPSQSGVPSSQSGQDLQDFTASSGVSPRGGVDSCPGTARLSDVPSSSSRSILPSTSNFVEDADRTVQGAAGLTRPLRILVVNNIVPNHDRGGSCARMASLLAAMRERGHSIEYLARDARGMETYVRDLEQMGVVVHGTDPKRLAVWEDVGAPPLDVAGLLERGRFDVAILLLWFWSSPTIPEHYLDEIRRRSPETRIVVLTDDVHWLHDARLAALTGRQSDFERALGFREREREIYARADLVAAITEEDAARIRAEELGAPVSVLPHHLAARPVSSLGFESRRDLLIAGAFGYHANVDGATWFLREVWPAVHPRLPGVRLKIVGSDPPPSLETLARGSERVDVTGWVPDLDDEMDRCRVFISPIRYGTGLKTKNVQAMRAGIPVVGTGISLEGSGARSGNEACIEDDAARFAEAVVTLYTSEAAWSRQARAARTLFESRFTRASAVRGIDATLARAIEHEARRLRSVVPVRAPNDAIASPGSWSIQAVETRNPRILEAQTAVERFRLRLDGHYALAVTHLRAHRPHEALSEMRRLLSHSPSGAVTANPRFFAGLMCRFGDAYAALAELGDRERRSTAAATDADEQGVAASMVERNPRLARAALSRDQECGARDDSQAGLEDPCEAARACYVEALSLNPDEDEAREGLRALEALESSRKVAIEEGPPKRAMAIALEAGASADAGTETLVAMDSNAEGIVPKSARSPRDSVASISRPRPVSIERKGRAFLASALEGDLWKGPLHAYLERFTMNDDVSLLLLGASDRLEPDLLAWVRAQGLDEDAIADIVIVPPPRDPRELPRFVAAADAVLASCEGAADLLAMEARRQQIPVLVAGRDDLGATRS